MANGTDGAVPDLTLIELRRLFVAILQRDGSGVRCISPDELDDADEHLLRISRLPDGTIRLDLGPFNLR